MESSTVLAFRIFVMLSCLIIVPLAAIFGSAFPDVVKTVLVDRIVAWSTGKAPEQRTDVADGSFREVKPVGSPRASASTWDAPRWGAESTPASWQAPDASAQQGGVVPAGVRGVPAVTDTRPANHAVASDPRAAGLYPPMERVAANEVPRGANGDLSGRTSMAALGPPGHDGPPGAQALGFSAGAEQPDRFTAMERRLRELGATYYLLETWGQQGELYRFHCTTAVGNNPNYTRHYEATDRDALRAMALVLEQVEGRRTPRPQ